jgi:hypothetical protein
MMSAYNVKKAMDNPVFLRRNPMKNANIKNVNIWKKNPTAKLIFLNMIAVL